MRRRVRQFESVEDIVTYLVFAGICIALAILSPKWVAAIWDKLQEDKRSNTPAPSWLGILVRVIFSGIAAMILFSTSALWIDSDKVGHMKSHYGQDMPAGRIVATNWQKGPQAEILGPGFHFRLFVKIMCDVEELDVVKVEADTLLIVTAKDGRPLPEGQYLADEWPKGKEDLFLDAEYFMGADTKDGVPRGQRGPQQSVLKPGTHRLNRYLFDVGKPVVITEVHAGEVGVIKSNVGKVYDKEPIVPASIIESYVEANELEIKHQRAQLNKLLADIDKQQKLKPDDPAVPSDKAPVAIPTFDPNQAPLDAVKIKAELDALQPITKEEAKKRALNNLSNPLVPEGYIGVWNKVLLPGKYYLNTIAYHMTHMDTRVQTWRYEGGYKRRMINLTVANDGSISQVIVEQDVPKPADAADEAIIHKVEGWDVWLDSRVLVQVTPDNAPFVVAYVGDLQQVEDRIITPMYRSVSRNILGNRDVKVLQVLYERAKMEELVETAIKPEGLKTGLIIRDVRFGDPFVPPELLIPGKRMQLAQQMNETFNTEKTAQATRIESEAKKATADQQSTLIKAQIQKQADQAIGEGTEARLKAEAHGQQAQVSVLGTEKTFQLSMFREILAAIKERPELVKVPTTLVESGGGNGLSSAAAILGNSNLSKAVESLTK